MAEVQEQDASSSIRVAGDGFDSLPDSLVLVIFNFVSDVKALIRCRAVSKRFNSLVPHSDSLFLKIDCSISSDSESDSDSDSVPTSNLFDFFQTTLQSFFYFMSPVFLKSKSQKSPAQILRQFHRIQRLQIEFPTKGLEVSRAVKWRAEFGDTLRSCVILSFQKIRKFDGRAMMAVDNFGVDFFPGMEARVTWLMRTLITALARHHVMAEVVVEHLEMKHLVLRDGEGNGVVVIEKNGLEDFRRSRVCGDGGETSERRTAERRTLRTRVPRTTVRMKYWPLLDLQHGFCMEDATLVVVRPTGNASEDETADMRKEDADLALRAFEDNDVYTVAVAELLTKGTRFKMLINSF
ncbi:F-box protein At1g78100-like [Cucurbita maxima]|uniref:F-box protein At1g78100-like n=1 Tax=Cucurbita maxima TaxID=3661 RepID=A0A6J1KAU0_CUCMA|nr:F-box protein At1g78100-like [Cucurbita maxima]